MSTEKGAYVLGTDRAELHRLGFQHQVWASEARRGWEIARFGYGQTVLDLGCGPGFATIDLAYLVGPEGKVIAVDKSENYLNHLQKLAEDHQLTNIEIVHCDFSDLDLSTNSVDRIYHRWALAWVDNVDVIISKMVDALKPGGILVSQEYFDWSTLQLEPIHEDWLVAKRATLRSFKERNSDIDIGRYLPRMFAQQGLSLLSKRPMIKMGQPSDLQWNWPTTFFELYFPRVADMGYMTHVECNKALEWVRHISGNPQSIMLTPTMIEIIAQK